MVKRGPKCALQLAYLDRLAIVASDRVPRVLARWHGGYAMELLAPYEPNAQWPQHADLVLSGAFWNRGPVVGERNWQDTLKTTLEIEAPAWTWMYERTCATHGDPTLSNTMQRAHESGLHSQLVFVDPVWPERVPQIASVDKARIVQSMMGWELMTGFQTEHIEWREPRFLHENETSVAITAFWTMVMMARIAASDRATEQERAWAEHIRDEIRRALPCQHSER